MKTLIVIFLVLGSNLCLSQNTVGTISTSSNVAEGYTLFAPITSSETYLMDTCGRVINQWTSAYQAGNSCYLLENGNLLRAGKIANADITFGGVGGVIQLFDWDGSLLWEYTYSTPLVSQHHDVFPLPNGNILMLAVTTITADDAIARGRNPALITENKIFNEQVLELQPVGTNQANVIWEWNVKDHLIQDFDATKSNFGVVSEHPELLDFNFNIGNSGFANWLHINSVQYNEALDQIILSSRLLSEVYIIDHSTTTAEAATNSGGTYGKGGDILYRWGNPQVYDKGDGSDQTLFNQHYPYWIEDGLTDAGKIMIFNNGNTRGFSSVDIISPPSSSPGVYSYDAENGYGPTEAEWSYTNSDPAYFNSTILSSAERLPNGNTLICDGNSGFFFEINSDDTVVWEYVNPDTSNGIASQGTVPTQNNVFRVKKLSPDYPAFIGRDLTPGDPIELNPDLSVCESLSLDEFTLNSLQIFPNPTKNILNVKYEDPIDSIEMYNSLGELVLTEYHSNTMQIGFLPSGLYILKVSSGGSIVSKKILKQ